MLLAKLQLSIDSQEFKEKFAAFTLTNLPDADCLELMIKIYSEHKGLTLALSKHKTNDMTFITNTWDS